MRGSIGLSRGLGLATICVVLMSGCASNYAPVAYRTASTSPEGGVAGSSHAGPAPTPIATAGVGRVESLTLGSTVISQVPPVAQSSAPPPAADMQVANVTPTVNAPPSAPVAREQPLVITVQPGDTVYSLSRAHGADKNAIVAANHLTAPYGLRVGQVLMIPKSSGAAQVAPAHVVRKGDTLYSIARAQGADVHELAALNNIAAPYTLSLGQEIKLPASAPTTMVANAPASSSAGGPLLTMGAHPSEPASAPEAPRAAPSAPVAASLERSAPPVSTPAKHGDFIWPVSGRIISTFGPKDAGRRNDGVNIAVASGAPVRASRDGEVIYVGNEIRGYGNLVLIRHDGGFVTAYAHNSAISVKRGDYVRQGDQIASAGNSGGVDEPQVHFEIRKDRKPIDPAGYLPNA